MVVLAGLALRSNRYKSCADDLTNTGLETLGAEVLLKYLKKLRD